MSKQSKVENQQSSVMDQLMASYDNRRLSFSRGEKITGEVISFNNTEVILDLRAKAEGVLNKKDLSGDTANNIKAGDRLDVFVVFPENDSGQVVVSCFRQENISGRSRGGRKIDLSKWQKFIQGKETKALFNGEISEVNRGGVIVNVDGIRGFVPSSQVSLRNLTNQSELTGNNLKLTVIEVDPGNNKLVFSARPNLNEEERKELLGFEVGKEITGKIVAVTPFGLFVVIKPTPGEPGPRPLTPERSDGGQVTPGVFEAVEGIVYPQETTWEIPEAGVDVDLTKGFKAGTEITTKITSIDENLGRLNLSLRQMEEDPFTKVATKFEADDVITGVVTNITQNGVDIKLEGDLIGFLPVEKTEGQIYKMGQKTNFLVDSVDNKNRKINLAPFLTSTVGLIYK